MKKYGGIIAAALLAGVLTGCGGEDREVTSVRYTLREVTPEQLQAGVLFQLENIAWNSEPSAAMMRIESLEKYPEESGGRKQYGTTGELTLLGEDAEVSLFYEQNLLREAELRMNPEETEAYTEELLEELEALYGSGSYSEEDGVNITFWQSTAGADTTCMQVEENAEDGQTALRLWWEAADGDSEITISLESIRDGEAYRYAQIPWDSSREETEERLGEALNHVTQIVEKENDIYKLPGTRTLTETGEQVEIEFEFRENRLKKVNIRCRGGKEEGGDELYRKFLEAVSALCGEPQETQAYEVKPGVEQAYANWQPQEQTTLSVLRQGNVIITIGKQE